MLPLWCDLSSRKVVVFGGGEVGRRKANYLASEAEVIVVSREFVSGFLPSIMLRRGSVEEHLSELVDWADLVVAATDDATVNGAVATEAARRGKFCNRADGLSTFLIPSVVDREHYKVAVSTEGRSPGMSRYMRQELDRLLDTRYDHMVSLQMELREAAKKAVPTQVEREHRLWKVLEDQEIWAALESDPDGARERAMRIVVG